MRTTSKIDSQKRLDAFELIQDGVRFRKLLLLAQEEDSEGNFGFMLRYANSVDVAQVCAVNGECLESCGDLELEPEAQFRRAVDILNLNRFFSDKELGWEDDKEARHVKHLETHENTGDAGASQS